MIRLSPSDGRQYITACIIMTYQLVYSTILPMPVVAYPPRLLGHPVDKFPAESYYAQLPKVRAGVSIVFYRQGGFCEVLL